MNRISLLLVFSSLAVLSFAEPSAHAAPSTYTFNTKVTNNPDGGSFWSVGDDTKGHLQGTLLLEFDYDSATNTGSVHTDHDLTSLFFGSNCTSSNTGTPCYRYKVYALASTSVTKVNGYYQITFYFIQDNNTGVNYWAQFLIGEATTYLGTDGATLSGIYHSDSHTSAWVGASGKLCPGSGCS